MRATPLGDLAPVKDRFTLVGKAALVTGAAGGIGRTCAAALADLGADVAIADLPERFGDAESVAAQIADRYGVRAVPLGADVGSPEEVDAMFESAVEALGGLDVVHSNAGIITPNDNADMAVAEWDRIVRVNLTGMFLVNRCAAGVIRESGGGAIVNTASMSASIVNRALPGTRHAVAYTATKAAVKHLTKAMAVEFAPVGIRVNSVSPGVVLSGIHDPIVEQMGISYDQFAAAAGSAPFSIPLGRFGMLDEIGGVVAFLATDLASYITGVDILVDGGTTVW
jgi:NAD(P)-dependent dehydrogenase (short-subunit alcohol dehydrogenase family)